MAIFSDQRRDFIGISLIGAGLKITAQDEASASAPPWPSASHFSNISYALHALRHFIEGVWMAAGDVSGQAEILALRALLDVAGEKIGAMKGAMQEARLLVSATKTCGDHAP